MILRGRVRMLGTGCHRAGGNPLWREVTSSAEGEPLVVRLAEPPHGSADPAHRASLAFEIRQGENTANVAFRFSNIEIERPGMAAEAALALALVPAMKLGSALRIEGAVAAEVLRGAERFQEIFSVWYPEFRRVPIEAEGAEAAQPADDDRRGVGLFFSGGLDSIYSLIKNRDELTHLIFVHGCDVPLANTAYRERVTERLERVAGEFGVRLVEVETDLLEFSDRYCHWGYHYHGSALAAMAMLMSGSLRKVSVAASYVYSIMEPWGSTFITDPLWSSRRMQIANDGGERDRIGKARAVAKHPGALRHLRVCFENPDGGYNCGRCEKCCRTMICLRLCGALDDCPAFDEALDLQHVVESEEIQKAAGQSQAWQRLCEEAIRRDEDPQLVTALTELMRRSRFHQLVRDFAQMKNDITASPPWREAIPKFRTALWDSLRETDPDWFIEKSLKGLPDFRDRAAERLWRHDRRWFKRWFRSAKRTRLFERLQGRVGGAD